MRITFQALRYALLSSELKEWGKLDIIEHEYKIPISKEFREAVSIMCNLSIGIEERVAEKLKELLKNKRKAYSEYVYKRLYIFRMQMLLKQVLLKLRQLFKKRKPAMA